MRELQDFERRLGEALEAVAGRSRSVDAAGIARAAIIRARGRSAFEAASDRLARQGTWLRPVAVLRLAAVALLLAALVAAAAGVGNRTSVGPDPFPACPGYASERDLRDETVGARPGWRATSQSLPGEAIAAFMLDLPHAPLAVVLVDAATGAACRLIDFTTLYGLHAAGSLSWSPTGSALAIAVESRLFIWADGQLLLVWRNPDPQAPKYPSIAWAPDGSAIAVRDPLEIIHADGSPSDELPVDGSHPRWSPDGSRLTVERDLNVDGNTVITLIDVATGATSELSVGTTESLGVVGWLDGETLLVRAYASAQGSSRVLTVSIDDPAGFSSAPAEGPGLALYAPDLSKVALILQPETTSGSELSIVDRTTGARRVVARDAGPAETWMSLAWAPDSAGLAYTTVQADEPRASALWAVDASGGEPRRLIEHPLLLYPGGWRTAPDRDGGA